MQRRHLLRLRLAQARAQDVGKQVMIAIPLAPVVQRHHEQVGALQTVQRRRAVCLPADGLAQRTAQPLQNRSLQQEAADRFGLALQDLFDQIVDDVAVAAGECLNKTGAIGSPLHR